MERLADIINVIHNLCLVLVGLAYLVGGWLMVNQFMALL